MEKNKKGRWIIHSLKELPEKDQKKVNRMAIAFGVLACLIYFEFLYILNFFPKYSSSLSNSDALFFYCVVWIAMLTGVFLCSLPIAACGLYCMLAELGYSLINRNSGDNYAPNSLQQPFSDIPFSNPTSSYSSSMSINTGSGLPMCGSSGMDVRGNPAGTSSW